MADRWTDFFRSQVENWEVGLPNLKITNAMYQEFGSAAAALMEKLCPDDAEPNGTEDRTLYRVWLGVKTHAYEPCPIEFDYYQHLAALYQECGQITQSELDAYRDYSAIVRTRV
ncbi:hypothetical protein IP81_05255 [Novosphingobium sp. AAP83]|nr:hypothetical protein IP81_05255 [Novosphingobium sp. AAP83]